MGVSGTALADVPASVASGSKRSGMASINKENPGRSNSESNHSLTGQTGLATPGAGGAAIPRLEEIA